MNEKKQKKHHVTNEYLTSKYGDRFDLAKNAIYLAQNSIRVGKECNLKIVLDRLDRDGLVKH